MNKKKSLVSIIAPVYNVEQYIEQCIKSMINQTYENCEFIFVNDGTKDNSVDIIKKYMKKDDRIKLKEQKNAGVSSARNLGLKGSHGEYIVFVDSDDYLATDFVEYMLTLIEKNNCDFAFSTKNFKRDNDIQEKDIVEKVISSEEAIASLLSPDVTVGCWNKIYRKKFLDDNGIYFSTSLFYGEGLQFIIDCSNKANTVAVSNKKIYYYRKNNVNSATTKYNIEKYYNGEKSLKLIERKINMNNEYIKSMYLLHISTFYLGAIIKMIENNQNNNYYEDYSKWKKNIVVNLKYIKQSKHISLYRKCMLIFGSKFPKLLAILDKSRNKRIIKKSIK